MIGQIMKLQMGNLYAVSDDTAAVISLTEEKEVYARIESLLDQSGHGIAAAIIHPNKDEDIFAEIENRLSACKAAENQKDPEKETDENKKEDREEDTSEAFSMEELLNIIQEE